MSCFYRSLPYLIPQLLLAARPNSHIILVSPWIDDVALYPPMFVLGENRYERDTIRLSELLLYLARDSGMYVSLVVRDRDARFHRVVRPLRKAVSERIQVKMVPHLHAKAIITDRFVLTTSANLIPTSLSRNIETCQLSSNHYGNAAEWLLKYTSISV